MDLVDNLKSYANEFGATLSEKKGVWTFTKVVAERKAFLSKKKLEYIAKFRVEDESKVLKFTEMLKESGSGLTSGGGGFDGGMSTGFGFKTESYNTMNGGQREGSIEEQSTLFGKDYSYTFDYKEVRAKLEELAKNEGYDLKYQITSLGL